MGRASTVANHGSRTNHECTPGRPAQSNTHDSRLCQFTTRRLSACATSPNPSVTCTPPSSISTFFPFLKLVLLFFSPFFFCVDLLRRFGSVAASLFCCLSALHLFVLTGVFLHLSHNPNLARFFLASAQSYPSVSFSFQLHKLAQDHAGAHSIALCIHDCQLAY